MCTLASKGLPIQGDDQTALISERAGAGPQEREAKGIKGKALCDGSGAMDVLSWNELRVGSQQGTFMQEAS